MICDPIQHFTYRHAKHAKLARLTSEGRSVQPGGMLQLNRTNNAQGWVLDRTNMAQGSG